jgi:hypothetical protein
MRLLVLPLVAVGLIATDQPREPGEAAMRFAFENKLQLQVAGALEFLAETSGPESVERAKSAGTDRFEVRSFRKLDCRRDDVGHLCSFAVDVSVTTGVLQHTLKGRFMPAPGGQLTFFQEG